MSKSHGRKSRRHHLTRRAPPGAPPGTLIADPEAAPSHVRVMSYGPHELREKEAEEPSSLPGYLEKWPVTWVNVTGLGDLKTVRQIGESFGLHMLALEDVVNVHQRSKVEHYGTYDFIVSRAARRSEHLETGQVSLFLGKNFVITFLEQEEPLLEPVRERLRKGSAQVRSGGPDYLAYAILDALLDSYFPLLEDLGERLELLEDEVVLRPGPAVVARIHEAKRDLLTIRRAVWPQRDALGILYRDPSTLVAAETRLFLRDCYDHTVQIVDLIETYREMASGMMDVYLSSVSNRMNEVMKVLTIIATIFIPLSFIASLYGMNFNTEASRWNMPELGWRYGYLFALGVMALMAGGMLLYFRRKGWLGAQTAAPPSDSEPTD